jgi:hypothetical protein
MGLQRHIHFDDHGTWQIPFAWQKFQIGRDGDFLNQHLASRDA